MVEARARFLHQLKRYYYVTPTSYLELINLYGTMLQDQKTKINGAKERISNGLKVGNCVRHNSCRRDNWADVLPYAQLARHLRTRGRWPRPIVRSGPPS